MGKDDWWGRTAYGGVKPLSYIRSEGKAFYPYLRDPITREFLRDPKTGKKLPEVCDLDGMSYWIELSDQLKDGIIKAVEPYPIPEGKKYQYGTAGVSLSSYFNFLHLT
jgi:hypothetical protein